MMRVTLYTKPGCGLCEEAEEVIEAVGARVRFNFVRRNILDDLTDYDRYKHDIPVVHVDGREVARHHLDELILEKALAAPAVAIVVMAKFPTPGRVKTRLMPELSPEQAATVHRTFLLHVVARLRDRTVTVCCDPPERTEEMRELLAVSVMPQSSGDLGDRLAAAATTARDRLKNLIFLGVDSPDVPLAYIDRVSDLLSASDVVIGPADDGGYWTVALSPRVDAAKLFAAIEWSSGRECGQTLERARALGYNVSLADAWPDVDRPADLVGLLKRLRESKDPADRQLLERLNFLPASLDGVV